MLALTRRSLFAGTAILAALAAAPDAYAQRVNRGPYLQSGTPTQVTVRWRTSSNTDSVVRYGTSRGSLNRTARASGSRTEHAVTIRGLAAETRYYYSVGSSAGALLGGDADTYFETAPPVGSTGHTRVWAIGDSGTANGDARDVYNAYRNFAGGNYTDLWLMLGDNAYNDGRDSEYQRAVFDMYPQLLRQTVLWPTLGNHDGYTADSASESGPYYDIFTLPRRGEAGGVASGTEAYYSFDHANIHFVVLDSYETNRSPGSAMLRWLESDLQATTADWLIAFWHHPPYTKGSHDSDSEGRLIDMRENVLPILERYGVDLVLAGHSHSYERSFLLDGHYGRSGSLRARNLIDGGDGRRDGDGAYGKPTEGIAGNEGSVYVVAGSSGKRSGGRLNHPAMFVSLNQLGSVVLDITDLTLDAKFLNDSGRVTDYFTLVKGDGSGCPITETRETSCGDGVDNDCDGFIDGLDSDCCPDRDGDGYNDASCGGSDCDDGDRAINPGAIEVCGDVVDNDCNGDRDCRDAACGAAPGCCADVDGDGYTSPSCGGSDCDDTDPRVRPNAGEVCGDGIDNDCDRLTDCAEASCAGVGSCPAEPRIVMLTAVDDAFVSDASRGTNYGNAGSLEIDTASTFKYSLIRPRGLGDIAPGASVVSAELVVTVFNPGDTVQIREVLQSWSEGSVTYDNAPDTAGSPLATFPGNTGTVAVDITSIAQRWVNGAPLRGLQLWPTDSNGVDIRSSEYATSDQRPYFVFEVLDGVGGCPDADGDGFTDAACGGDDCNDGNRGVNPDAAEVCGDGIDNDCRGGDATCAGNRPPQLSFVQPSANPPTNDLGVVIDASDPDGRIAQILLYIDGQLVRREGFRPYEWGTANGNQTDSALLNLADGEYELRAVATDDDGASTTATLTVRVGDEDVTVCDDELVRGERLAPGQSICSPNGTYQFGLTAGGELNLRAGSRTLWAADMDSGATQLNMQGDGNLVVYNGASRPLWASNTAGRAGATLTLENAGRAVIRLDGSVLWSVGGDDEPPPPRGSITHLGTTEIWDANGQNIVVNRVPGTRAGDLLVLALHRTDDDLPLFVDGWTRVAECYKRNNGAQCVTGADCRRWENARICREFTDGGNGHDLAQAIFVRTVQSGEPSSYRFDLNADSSGAPGWAILIALRGADTSDPVRDWSFRGCDNNADSVFPSVYGERGDMVLLSQSFDDAIAQSRFRAPSGLTTFGYVSNSDEAGFLFGGILDRAGETGTLRTGGDGGPNCKDGLVSLTVKPRR